MANLRPWFANLFRNGAQGRDRTFAYPTENLSFFEWRLSSVPIIGPGALFAAGRVRLCVAIPKSCACHALYEKKIIRAVCPSEGKCQAGWCEK
jgi:hypothetical protein